MTATDELRRMLDERVVEWEDMSIRPYACTSWRDPDGEPCTALEGADDIPDGKLSAQALLTPAQAIAATLGDTDATAERRGDAGTVTHRTTTRHGKWRTKYGRSVPVCECCGYGIGDERWNYCPSCGAEVVE